MPLLAHVFEEEDALDKLESFASRNGPAFYGLPVNAGTIRLENAPSLVSGRRRSPPRLAPSPSSTPVSPVHWHVVT